MQHSFRNRFRGSVDLSFLSFVTAVAICLACNACSHSDSIGETRAPSSAGAPVPGATMGADPVLGEASGPAAAQNDKALAINPSDDPNLALPTNNATTHTESTAAQKPRQRKPASSF